MEVEDLDTVCGVSLEFGSGAWSDFRNLGRLGGLGYWVWGAGWCGGWKRHCYRGGGLWLLFGAAGGRRGREVEGYVEGLVKSAHRIESFSHFLTSVSVSWYSYSHSESSSCSAGYFELGCIAAMFYWGRKVRLHSVGSGRCRLNAGTWIWRFRQENNSIKLSHDLDRLDGLMLNPRDIILSIDL